jgi:quinoprotein dehydrogenase-associated probable ABC transporter substrate-binding protein
MLLAGTFAPAECTDGQHATDPRGVVLSSRETKLIMVHKIYASAAVVALGAVSWLGVGELHDTGTPRAGVDAVGEVGAEPAQEQLRVCADPNNLPFSNRQEEGFHNRLAELFAEEMGLDGVTYTWWPQRRGFVRNTLKKKRCDVIFGVPEGYDILQSTRPFYRSPYVIVQRADADFEVTSLDDPILAELEIGVALIGDDYMNTPPAHVLSVRGINSNVEGYPVYGDYSEDSPPKEIVLAVARGDVDVAMVWGPVAGYWASRQDVELTMHPLPAVDEKTGLPLNFSMSLGVRRGEEEWQARLEKVIEENHERIYAILRDEYDVPLLPLEEEGSDVSGASHSAAATGPAAAPAARLASRGVPGPSARAEERSEPGDATWRRALASGLAPAERAAAQDTPVVSQHQYDGWKWLMVHCARCHGETGGGSSIAPSMLEAVEQDGFTRDSFIQVVMNGRVEKGMPAWNELLDEEEAGAIHDYIEARTKGLRAGRPTVGDSPDYPTGPAADGSAGGEPAAGGDDGGDGDGDEGAGL